MAAAKDKLVDLPRLGLGLGLRNVHFDAILSGEPRDLWFEAISENFMDFLLPWQLRASA